MAHSQIHHSHRVAPDRLSIFAEQMVFCPTFVRPLVVLQSVQWRVLLPLSVLLLSLSTFAIPQPQHQIGAQLS